MRHRLSIALAAYLALSGCSTAGHNSEWDNIDYERIARDNQRLENDSSYVPPRPTVTGCIDEDLYNCNRRQPTYSY